MTKPIDSPFLQSNAEDISGKTFGEWKVSETWVRRKSAGNHSELYWWCTCSCGTARFVSAFHLKQGNTTQCRDHSKRTKPNYLAGHTVHHFTVVSNEKGLLTLECVCGRIRTWFRQGYKPLPWTSCGCQGGPIYLFGAPDLPPGVTSWVSLLKWAGVSRQLFDEWLSYNGWPTARGYLLERVSKKYPGMEDIIDPMIPEKRRFEEYDEIRESDGNKNGLGAWLHMDRAKTTKGDFTFTGKHRLTQDHEGRRNNYWFAVCRCGYEKWFDREMTSHTNFSCTPKHQARKAKKEVITK